VSITKEQLRELIKEEIKIFRGKLTKSQLKQIVKEELEAILDEDIKDKAIRTAWDLYCDDRGGKPEDPHPDGEKAEERCSMRRKKKRTAQGKST